MVREEDVKSLKLWSGSGRVTGRPPGSLHSPCVYMASGERASSRWGLSRCHAVEYMRAFASLATFWLVTFVRIFAYMATLPWGQLLEVTLEMQSKVRLRHLDYEVG